MTDRDTSLRFRPSTRAAKPQEKALAKNSFIHCSRWPLINFIGLHYIKPMTASISHCDRVDWHMKTWHIRVTGQIWSGSKFSVFENILIQSLDCRIVYNLTLMLCVMVYVLQTCIREWSKIENFWKNLNFSLSRTTICLSAGYQLTRKFEVTVKEIANFSWEH